MIRIGFWGILCHNSRRTLPGPWNPWILEATQKPLNSQKPNLLGGSWVVTSRVISPLIGLITRVTLLITPTYSYP